MYYDLNIPFGGHEQELKQRLAFLSELGYNVLVISHLLPEKLPSSITSPIVLPQTQQPALKRLKLLTRCTIPILSPANSPGPRIVEIRKHYDIVAVRPTDEKTLQLAVTSLDSDIISINLARRYSFHFRPKTFAPALAKGIKIELCYGASIALGGSGGRTTGTTDAEQRRNVLMNASEIVRSTRGRGIVISSEAASVLGCRGPHDVINLAGMWGLSKELAAEAVSNGARSVVAAAQLRKRSFRGAVDVVEVVLGEGGDSVSRRESDEKAVNDDMHIEGAFPPDSVEQKKGKKRPQRTSRGSADNESTSLSKRSKK